MKDDLQMGAQVQMQAPTEAQSASSRQHYDPHTPTHMREAAVGNMLAELSKLAESSDRQRLWAAALEMRLSQLAAERQSREAAAEAIMAARQRELDRLLGGPHAGQGLDVDRECGGGAEEACGGTSQPRPPDFPASYAGQTS